METSPKRKRGKPRKLPEPRHQEARRLYAKVPKEVRESAGLSMPTERTAANRFYAERAREVIPGLANSLRMPEDPVRAANLRIGMDWVLRRTTVLTELGRMVLDEPSKEDVARFQSALMYIAGKHPDITAKEAAAYVRDVRLGRSPAGSASGLERSIANSTGRSLRTWRATPRPRRKTSSGC